jgi:hypothetical protein
LLVAHHGEQLETAMEMALTEEMIAAAMAKADARVCGGNDRCNAFPERLQDARQTCTPMGQCMVG